MRNRIWSYAAVILVTMAVMSVYNPLSALQGLAQSDCRVFSETGKQVCGRFLQYWQQNGGLAQQGLPLSNEFQEVSDLNGLVYTVQYFERSVFEKHPENAAPYDVLLSQLGTFQFKRKYPNGEPAGGAQPPAPPQPTQPSQPAPQPAGLTFSGHGKQITSNFQLKSGALRWHAISKNGDSNFIVHVVSASTGRVEAYLANEIGESDTTGIENVNAGTYVLDVLFDGDWQVILEQ